MHLFLRSWQALATADADVLTLVNAQATTGIDTLKSLLTTNLPLVIGIILSITGFWFIVKLIRRSAGR